MALLTVCPICRRPNNVNATHRQTRLAGDRDSRCARSLADLLSCRGKHWRQCSSGVSQPPSARRQRRSRVMRRRRRRAIRQRRLRRTWRRRGAARPLLLYHLCGCAGADATPRDPAADRTIVGALLAIGWSEGSRGWDETWRNEQPSSSRWYFY